MAQTTTSSPQQQVNMPAVDLRQMFGGLIAVEGVHVSGDLAVTQRAAGANMSVDVAAGSAFITDDHATGGGFYAYTLAAATNYAVGTADPTNPRIDRVVVRVRDAALGDAANDQGPVVLAGTPTAAANLTNLNGAASVPGSSLLLANVLVPAASSSVTTANIDTTVRTLVAPAGGLTRLAPTVTLSAAAASFDFQNIPQTFSQLALFGKLRGDTAAVQTSVGIRFNNDSAANYSWGELRGITTTASMANATGTTTGLVSAAGVAAASAAAGAFSPVVMFLPSYSVAQWQELLALSSYVGSPGVHLTMSHWGTTAAVTRITVAPGAGNWVAGSSLTIFGMG